MRNISKCQFKTKGSCQCHFEMRRTILKLQGIVLLQGEEIEHLKKNRKKAKK